MLAIIFTILLLDASEMDNPLLKELLAKGLPLPAGPTLRLPPPLMTNALTPQQQHVVVSKAAGSAVPLDLFLKKTDAAPFALKINSVESTGKRLAQTVDLYFIAYGNLDRVVREDVLNQLIGTDAKKGKNIGKAEPLSPAALEERGIKVLQAPNLEERYAGLDIFLLERVKITGITRNVKTYGPGWAELAMQLDPRFDNDKKDPNSWRSYSPLNETLGPPQPYTGLGGYARVTKLAQPAGALFFELHVALHEPEAWFGGPNLLRSKLPLVIQENVRNLRRKLARE
ncbi:MAG TPA: hypothetical protein VNX28_10850 [Gemmataceae bacterium]|jgi:hypothetical protein|nr:hypothetical protein [Gemmataceae bacterium]